MHSTPQNLQTYFSGNVMGESAMKTAHDVGSPVSFVFTVENEGEPLNSLVSLILAVEWPYEVANGKWLLYLTEVRVKTKSVMQCQPAGGIIDPLNLTLSESKRWRREAVKFELPDVQVLPAVKRPNTVLRCGGGGANCVRFECPLNDMEKFAEITVLARVWNSTFLEDYRYSDRVWVEGAAELYLKSDIDSIKMRSQHVSVVTIDSELVEPPPAELPLWVIIVSVVSGILLLGVIIIILWKRFHIPQRFTDFRLDFSIVSDSTAWVKLTMLCVFAKKNDKSCAAGYLTAKDIGSPPGKKRQDTTESNLLPRLIGSWIISFYDIGFSMTLGTL
ncbi:unnamed protein product [Ranitomeya imitator]|uniref:Integrin alpha third immunoglobulin-like domain-containing protein n=1 Tax=Ranitomeya imitator TaxID=111125 RepID=A0ABN9LNK9_9NEOB|nr:unnamed protein product [Ranitomeya imitator]